MEIIDYITSGGKNVITTYLDDLPKKRNWKGTRLDM